MLDRLQASGPIEMVGEYTATICVVAMPVDQVRAMLRPEIVLADQDVTPPSTHPVIFGFGRHRNAHITYLKFLWDQNYLEHFTGVPYVHLNVPGDADKPVYYYVPRLYLNKLMAVLGGIMWYGFTKQMARISNRHGHYSIRSYRDHEDLLSLRTTRVGQPGTSNDFPNLGPMAQMLSQPMVGKMLGGLGPWVASSFDWGWDTAEVRSVEASMQIHRPYLPGLTPQTYQLPSIDVTPLGTFGVKTNWTLTLPYGPTRVGPG